MTALATQQIHDENKIPDGGNDNNSGVTGNNSLMHGTIGPAALCSPLIYHIMELYGEIIDLNQEQQVDMVKAQLQEVQAQAHATREAGIKLQNASIASGVLTILGAVGGLVAFLGFMSFGKGGEITKRTSDIDKELKPMNDIEKNLNIDAEKSSSGLGKQEKLSDQEEKEINSRVEQFKKSQFDNADNTPATRKAVERMKAQGDDPKDKFDFEKWKKQFNKDLNRKASAYNTEANNINVINSRAGLAKETITSLSSAGSNVANGIGQAGKAKEDAKALLFGAGSQQAANSAQDSGQAANKAAGQLNEEVRTLEGINRTNSVNG